MMCVCMFIQISKYTYIKYNIHLFIDGSFTYYILYTNTCATFTQKNLHMYEMSHFKLSWLVDNDPCKAEKPNYFVLQKQKR